MNSFSFSTIKDEDKEAALPVISVSKETSSAEHIQVADSFVPRAVCDEIVSAVDPVGLHDATIGGEVACN